MPDAIRGQAAPLFRHRFEVTDRVVSARLNICGLGYCEAFINGHRVGDQVLDPAQTDYDVRCLYVTHDVTALVQSGHNAIGVILGDGWYNQDRVWQCEVWQERLGPTVMSYGAPRLLARLEVLLTDGRRQCVVTDATWRCATGPIVRNNVYAGETYDARLERSGWNSPGFDDSHWSPAEPVPSPCERLEEQRLPPIKAIAELRPVSITAPRAGVWVADMGQNFSGWARIRVRGPEGSTIRLRFAEALSPDGMVDTASTGVFATKVEQIDTYTCKGGGIETWEPRFTYHGFRYVEITGWPGTPEPEHVMGIVVHTALERAGAFECSDARLNQLHEMALWTHRSNLHGLPEDCPARERCGWLGDAHIICEYSIYNFQGLAFWEKFLDDIETTRTRLGGLPGSIAPGKRTFTASPDWMAALILIPWYLHVYYGSRRALEQHWDGMRRVVEHFGEKADHWLLGDGLGDWCDPHGHCAPTHTLPVITTTVWFYECTRIMAQVAERLGHPQDAQRYREWLPRIHSAFQQFHAADRGTFGSQTANAMALHFGLVPPHRETAVVRSLVSDIRKTHQMHHTVGIMGLRCLFEVLTRHGHGDTALALMRQDTCPSFGDLIRRGATTLWEYWGQPEVDEADGPRSLNHPMMGGFDNWFYNTLAGIRPDEDQPGFKHFFLEPHPVQGLTWVRSHHDCPHGRIVSEWRTEKDRFEWNVTVPSGTTATATLPGTHGLRELSAGDHRFVT